MAPLTERYLLLHWPGPVADAYERALRRLKVDFEVVRLLPRVQSGRLGRVARVAPRTAGALAATFHGKGRWSFRAWKGGLVVAGLQDRAIQDALAEHPDRTIIFSGGGFVPKQLLDVHRFIHVHPGRLPEVRGSDCMWWSQAYHGETAATVFEMTAELDRGRILHIEQGPNLRDELATVPVRQRVHHVDHVLNPRLRAAALEAALTTGRAPAPAPRGGRMFTWMVPELKESLAASLFAEASQ